jgi:two-component system, OmpR family, response regulator QseB
MHVLLVEDDTDLADALADALRAAGHTVRHVGSAGTGFELASGNGFDALVLDLGLPDGDGMDLVRRLRESGCALPLIVITARLSLDDRIVGIDSGADDYLVKPFASAELVARLRAVARRASGQSASLWSFGDLSIDSARRSVSVAGQAVMLTPKEYELLHVLAARAGQVVPKHRLAHALSPFGTPLDFNALEAHVHQLRKKVGPQRVRTVRGVGYLFEGSA